MPGESVVEVGCGTARNLIRIARLYPGTELFGLDASQEMLRTAAQNIAAAGLTGRITLVHGYAEALRLRFSAGRSRSTGFSFLTVFR